MEFKLESIGVIHSPFKKLDNMPVQPRGGKNIIAEIEIKEKSKTNPQIIRALELTNQTGMVEWVDVDKDKIFGIFTRIPTREEVVVPIEERLIVELYSK